VQMVEVIVTSAHRVPMSLRRFTMQSVDKARHILKYKKMWNTC